MNCSKRWFEAVLGVVTVALIVFTIVVCTPAKTSQPLSLEQIPVSASASPEKNTLLDLNSATASELESLPGIGPVLAERILAWREENGNFTSPEDILSVSGIGQAKLEAIEPYITY